MTSLPTPVSMPVQQPSSRPRTPIADRLLVRARREFAQQRWEEAERAATHALALAPDDPEVIRVLGMVHQRRGASAKALQCFRRVLAVWPEDADLRIGLGIALYEQGEIDGAVEHLKRACTLAPAAPSAWYNLAEALERQAYTAEAIVALRRALELHPGHLPARLSLARARSNSGAIEAAVAEFREVLRRDPGNAQAWFGLSNLNTVRLDIQDRRSVECALARPGLSAHDGELLRFTLAKAFEDQCDYARAFEEFRIANSSRRARVKWDAAAEHRCVEEILRAFANGAPQPVDPGLGHEAILIVSIPRSGSTLVEHILASHPDIEGANEIGDLKQVIDAEGRRRGSVYPRWVAGATTQDWNRLGREYLARTARWRRTKPRFTDKSLVTWPLVGAALAMLPSARVVVVHRDPVETCLGCYRQCFSTATGFACDLDEMADYCIDFLRLTRFWLRQYAPNVFDLEYERLVAAPEATIRGLLDFCHLPFDRACLRFHETSRSVMSLPSAAQVRQPLRSDTARSARYGDRLDRLHQRLHDAGITTR